MHRRRTGSIARRSTNRGPRGHRSVVLLVTMGLLGALTVLVPAAVGPVAPAAADPPVTVERSLIAAGGAHTCAVAAGGVQCWGLNADRQLGTSPPYPWSSSTPRNVTGLGVPVSAVAAGEAHSCALTSAGGVKCWGDNSYGQVGNGATITEPVSVASPVDVVGLTSGVKAIAAGGNTTCALTTGGAVRCWGMNGSGQLGQGHLGNAAPGMSSVPLQVYGLTSGIASISVGQHHVCAVEQGGRAHCWGGNSYYELAWNGWHFSGLPLSLGSTNFSEVDAGEDHTCGVTTSGTVLCWGRNSEGQLGNGSVSPRSAAMVQLSGLGSDTVDIAVGNQTSCALSSTGVVKCWGRNYSGGVPVVVPGVASDTVGIEFGGSEYIGSAGTACALARPGAMRCWGASNHGQFGNGTSNGAWSPTPVLVNGGNRFSPASLSVRMTATETTAFIGSTISYQVTVTNVGRYPLTNVVLTDAKASCGSLPSTLALGASETINCTHVVVSQDVGIYSNTASAVAAEATEPSSATVNVTVPAPVPNMTVTVTAAEASVGVGQTMHFQVKVENTGNVALENISMTFPGGTCPVAVAASLLAGLASQTSCTRVATWQDVGTYTAQPYANAPPQITPNITGSATVTVVAPAENLPPTISVGSGHACGVTTNGALKCWGANDFGELGTGSSSPSNVPVAVSGLSSGVRSVSAGADHTCAVLNSGALQCWGDNTSGQLGNGTTTPSSLPVNVSGLSSGVAAVSAGNSSTCALRTNGVASCWGAGGLLGNGTPNQSSVPVEFMSDVVSIDVGGTHACAVTTEGAVQCWGNNEQNQLGTPVGANSLVPVQVTDLGSGYTSVATGGSHTCALSAGGAVKCWGAGGSGQIGNGNTTGAAAPTQVTGLSSGVRSLSVGNNDSCVVLTAGGAKCWGRNLQGTLGNGTSTQANSPVSVTEMTDGVEIAVGGFSCAVTSSWVAKCWGAGPTGNSTETSSLVPVLVSGGFNFGPPAPALAMTIAAQETSVLVGDTVHYEVTLTNVGNMAITNAHVVEIGGLTCPTNPNQALAVGASATTNCVHTAAAGDVGSFGMYGCGIFTEAFTTYCAAQVFVTVAALAPSLAVEKGADETDVLVGDTIHYTIDVINTGNVALHGVSLVDPDADCPTAPAATLAVGESDTVECTHEAVVGDVGTYSNIASATADEVTTPQPSNQVDVEVEAGTPELEVSKAADEASVIEGDTIHYDVIVENTGQVELTEVEVDDPNADCPTEPIATLAVGADTTVECAHVTDGDDVGTYSNTASATSTEVTTPVDSNQVDVTVVAANPSLDVDKAADESAVLVGATIHYDVTVSNTGNVTLHDVVVDDPDADCPSTPIATLAVGADEMIECTHIAVTGDIGTYSNVASATSTEVTTAVDSNQVDVAVSPVPAPSLSVVKSADQASVVAGQPIDYHVVVTNTGNVPLTGITVTDAHAPACDGAMPDLAVGAAHTVDCAYTTASPADVGTYSNTASVDSAQTSPQDSNTVDVTVVAQAPAVTIAQTVDESTVAAGGAIHYHLVVHNSGNVALSGLAISDPAAPACSGPLANLAAGASTTVHCAYTTVDPGDVGPRGNAAFVSSAQGAGALSNIVVTTVTAPAALEVVKAAAETTVIVGEAIHYEVTVTNTGGSVAHHVSVADPNATGCGGALGALAPGAETTVECTHVAVAGDIGTYENVASATADEVTTPVESNQVDVGVTSVPIDEGELSGTVTDSVSGDPIPGALLALLSTADFSMAGGFIADGQGHFAGRAPIGDYYVFVLDAEGAHTSGFFGSPTQVTVANATPAVADPVLVPTTGAVAGTVTDDTTGDPIPDTAVLTIDLGDGGGPGPGAVTDGAGAFTAAGLRPGPQLGIFIDLGGAHAPEYYDDSPDSAGSTPVAVDAGATTGGIEVGLPAKAGAGTGGHLVGTVTGTEGGDGLAGVAVVALSANTFAYAAGDLTDAEGNYDIPVGLGGYRLLFYDTTGTHQAEWFNNVALNDAPSSGVVTATAAQPTKRRDVSLAPDGGVVSGTITDAVSGDPIAGAWAVTIAPNGALKVAVTGTNGRYTRRGVAPGNNHLTFVNPNGGHAQQYWDDATSFGAGSILTMLAGDTVTGIDAALHPTN